MAHEISEEEKIRIKSMVDELVEKAKKASEEYLKLDQETVNNIIKAMAMAGLEKHMELAKMAIEETGRGILLPFWNRHFRPERADPRALNRRRLQYMAA